MEIKSYKKGDEIHIIDLFEKSFGKKMTLDFWKWRFLDNPFSKNIFIDLMWDNEILIGHYAVSPVEMEVNGIKVSCALSMTTMTHPDYAGKGIFSKLAESLYNRLYSSGYTMVWGFPNNNSHYGFNKNLKWSDIALQGMMSLTTERLVVNEIKSIFENVTKFDLDIAKIFQSSNKTVKINKNVSYLNWRYSVSPLSNYVTLIDRVNNVGIIYKKIISFSNSAKFEIDIMEINFNENLKILNDLLLTILSTEKDVIQFNIWDSLFSGNQILLEKIGFRIGGPVTYLGAKSFSNCELICDYKNWDISMGYSDVF